MAAAPKSVTFPRHDHLVSVLFGDLLSHSYNITFSMFLDLVLIKFVQVIFKTSYHCILSLYMCQLIIFQARGDQPTHTTQVSCGCKGSLRMQRQQKPCKR